MTLAVFDVCDTLFAVNTTTGFLGWFARETARPQLSELLDRWNSRSNSFFYVGATAQRLFGVDVARQRMVGGLMGETRRDLERSSAQFADHLLAQNVNRAVMDRLEAHRSNGDRVLLASSGLDLVVRPIAERLGVDFIASRLGFDGDVCTGKIEADRTGRKAGAVALLRSEGEEMLAYSDNRSDVELLKQASRAFVIWPRGSRAERWLGDEAEYVRL